jgi:hypothetical protein
LHAGRRRVSAVAGLILSALGLAPRPVAAQADFLVTPSVSLAGIYDSNPFVSRSRHEEDFILRLSPGLQVSDRSGRLDFQAGYVQDAEAYARHPELDSSRARQHVATGLRYESTPRSTVAADASYTETLRPGELTPETGLEFQRQRAARLLIAPSLNYRFDPVAVGTAAYGYTRDKLEGGLDTDTHTVTVGYDRKVMPRDTATFGYAFHRFIFGDLQVTDAHVVTAGGTHEFTRRTSATVSAGPRFSEGTTRPEVSALLRHRLQKGEISLSYVRTQATAIGLAGPVGVESMAAAAAYTPEESLEIRAGSSMATSARGGFEARAYRLNLEVRRRLTPYVSLIGSYDFNLQRGALDAPGEGTMIRHVVLLAVAWSPRAGPGSGR